MAESDMDRLARGRNQDGGASFGPGSREPSPKGLGPTGVDPSREASQGVARLTAEQLDAERALSLRRPPLEEATMAAIMSATNATFNWRGQEDLTPLMAVNICAGVIAYLRAMPPGYSLEELAVAIEELKLALGRDSDGSPKGEDGTASSQTTARAEGIAHD